MKKKLQVWWIPQVPMKEFTVEVDTVEEGVKIMNTLAEYDRFQYDNNVKPDYCNAGGLNQWEEDSDGEGTPGWCSWYDDDTGEDYPEAWIESRANAKVKGGRDVFPQAHRLAMELECLLLSCTDTAATAKWLDSANETLEQWREFCREDAEAHNAKVSGERSESAGLPS